MASELYKEVAPSGGDYTTLEACLNDNEQNLVSADQYLNIEITGDWTSTTDETNVLWHNYTTDSTRYISIYATGTAKHDGTAYKATAYELMGANDTTAAFQASITGNYIKMKDFVINSRGLAKNAVNKSYTTSNDWDIRNMIFYNSTIIGNIVNLNNELGHAINCIFFDCVRAVGRAYTGAGDFYCYNCTAYGNASATEGFHNVVCINCYSGNFDTTADFSSIDAGSDYLVSSDDTADDVATNYAINKSSYTDYFTSVTGGSEDFNLKNDSNSLWGLAGSDLSGTFTDDIVGTTRSAWDVGAFEYVAAGGWTHNFNGVANASISKINGVAKASISKVNGA